MFGKPKFHELPVPDDAKKFGGHEIARAVMVRDSLQVSLQKGFEDPISWGIVLADIAHHVARLFEQEKVCSEQQALQRIRDVFIVEMDKPTDLGKTNKVS